MEKKDLPSLRDFLMNLSEPMPLGKKVALLIRNNGIKVYTQSAGSGQQGEPGG